MNDLKTFWFHSVSPQSYHKIVNSISSGIVDERIIKEFIDSYLPQKNKIVVDLGIGTGRELVWLDKVSCVKKIIGLDYSPAMLGFLKKTLRNYQHKIEPLEDDLLSLSLLPKVVEKEKLPIVYISLINTFGNFSKEERLLALRNLTAFMKRSDRLILALYTQKYNTQMVNEIKNYPPFQTKNPKDQAILAELIEYAYYPFLWIPAYEKYKQMPRLWYDKKKNDVVIHLDGKVLLATHRFSKEEIEKEFKTAGLKIDKLIEGKAMWIVIGKK